MNWADETDYVEELGRETVAYNEAAELRTRVLYSSSRYFRLTTVMRALEPSVPDAKERLRVALIAIGDTWGEAPKVKDWERDLQAIENELKDQTFEWHTKSIPGQLISLSRVIFAMEQELRGLRQQHRQLSSDLIEHRSDYDSQHAQFTAAVETIRKELDDFQKLVSEVAHDR